MKKEPYNISAIRSHRLAFPFYFISDTHVGTYSSHEQDKRIKDILALLEEIRLSKGTLFILGDFFDFGFSKGSYIPERLKPVMDSLRRITEEGIEIHFIAGNHDFWIKGYLSRYMGLHFYPNAIDASFEGKNIFLQHGDRIVYGSILYPFVRKVMRSWLATNLLKILPVKWIYALGEKVSHYNRENDDIPRVSEKYILQMKKYLSAKNVQGYDLAISGHIHSPFLGSLEGKHLAFPGDWIHHRTYGYMDEDGFRLIDLNDEKDKG